MSQHCTVSDRPADGAAAPATRLYATPPGLTQPLRVTLVAPEWIPGWLSRFLELAAEVSWIDISVLPVADWSLPAVKDLPPDILAFMAAERLRPGHTGAMVSAVSFPAHPGVSIAPEVSADADAKQLRERMRKLRPDLILSLGPPAWISLLADDAEWGCWSLDAGLLDDDLAGTALLAPMLNRESATEIQLELLTPSLAPMPLVTSWGATSYGSFSRQREQAFLKLPLLLLRVMRQLAADDPLIPRRQPGELRQAGAREPLGVAAGARALWVTVCTTIRWQLAKRRRLMPWLLVLRQDSTPLDPAAPAVGSSTVVQAPKGYYWADPCMVERDGRKLIFVEEMQPSGKGAIACLELQPDSAARLGLALEEASHLSYPQVFAWDGEWYMTVESSQAKRVTLYQAAEFPLGWRRVVDLVAGRVCLDPTLHFHEGHWYLFATIAENGNSTWDELFLFVADRLEGPFQPHPANPIVSDVRRARPAGRLFQHGDKLIRPAQDCAACYGSAIVFNEVLELSPSHYREQPISRLAPDWADSLAACHTYSAAGGVEVLDARGYPPAGTPLLRTFDASNDVLGAASGAQAQTRANQQSRSKGSVDA
ncbi:glucosamine inositolphosphorylceramide transferase family protein [Lysobacter sp. D1-1-M9]|uniref:glucosamine inositolphosphorylceramide transferase family protein n=1 Tax=Novilysobacter longmucuonensis TaxID=3098603 RepID=UPI002FCA917F